MNPKKKKQEMHKLYCLCQLLLENLDTLNPTSSKMVTFKNDLIGLCELLNDDVANTYTIQKSTYFQQMTKQIDTIGRKQFDPQM